MSASTSPISCRWKHVGGKEFEAVYRATCGRPNCRGHLGDLAHRCGGDTESPPCREIRKRVPHHPLFWHLSASPIPGPEVTIYRGFPDSGYRMVAGGKRARNGARIGRRPIYEVDPFEAEPVSKSRSWRVDGQWVKPPALIWCRNCGTLNALDLPEGLRSHLALEYQRSRQAL